MQFVYWKMRIVDLKSDWRWLFALLVILAALKLPTTQGALRINLSYLALAEAFNVSRASEPLDRYEESFADLVRSYPDNLSTHYGLLLLQLNQGEAESAQKTLRTLKSYRPDGRLSSLGVFWVIRASGRLLEAGSAAQAKAVIRLLDDLQPTGQALLEIGKVYQSSGDGGQAEILYREVIRSFPGEAANAYLTLGQLYYEERNLAEATQAFEAALSIDPSKAYQVYWGLGLIGMSDSAEVAETWFMKAADAVPPGHLRLLAYLQIGNIYGIWCGNQCRYDQAEKYLMLAVQQQTMYQDASKQARANLEYVRQKRAED